MLVSEVTLSPAAPVAINFILFHPKALPILIAVSR